MSGRVRRIRIGRCLSFVHDVDEHGIRIEINVVRTSLRNDEILRTAVIDDVDCGIGRNFQILAARCTHAAQIPAPAVTELEGVAVVSVAVIDIVRIEYKSAIDEIPVFFRHYPVVGPAVEGTDYSPLRVGNGACHPYLLSLVIEIDII